MSPPRPRTLVVVAAFDPALDVAVAGLGGRLREAGVRVPRQPRHRPHLTLLGRACPEEATADLVAAVSAAAAQLPPVPVVLDEAGTFGRGAVLWAGCGPGPGRDALTAWHAHVVELVAAGGILNELGTAQPGRWVPHATLARRVRDVPAALAAVSAALPVTGGVAGLAVLEVGGQGDVAIAALATGPSATGSNLAPPPTPQPERDPS